MRLETFSEGHLTFLGEKDILTICLKRKDDRAKSGDVLKKGAKKRRRGFPPGLSPAAGTKSETKVRHSFPAMMPGRLPYSLFFGSIILQMGDVSFNDKFSLAPSGPDNRDACSFNPRRVPQPGNGQPLANQLLDDFNDHSVRDNEQIPGRKTALQIGQQAFHPLFHIQNLLFQ